MPDSLDHHPAAPQYTADELRAAVRLIDPTAQFPNEFYEQAASAPPESPWLLPFVVVVALAVVRERHGRAADPWLPTETPERRAEFEREREHLRRVARGEAPPPGWGA
jgi:hypothetical protein